MTARIASILLVAAFAACSSTRWVKQGVSTQQTDQDDIDCQRQAAREASLRAGGFYGPSYSPLFGPLGRRPVTRADTPFDVTGYRQLDEAQLTTLCMRAKGYQRAR
jgi:hypothetical protein